MCIPSSLILYCLIWFASPKTVLSLFALLILAFLGPLLMGVMALIGHFGYRSAKRQKEALQEQMRENYAKARKQARNRVGTFWQADRKHNLPL